MRSGCFSLVLRIGVALMAAVFIVAGAGLVPVPLPRASREELGVLEGAIPALNIQVSPREVCDPRRTLLLLLRHSRFPSSLYGLEVRVVLPEYLHRVSSDLRFRTQHEQLL